MLSHIKLKIALTLPFKEKLSEVLDNHGMFLII